MMWRGVEGGVEAGLGLAMGVGVRVRVGRRCRLPRQDAGDTDRARSRRVPTIVRDDMFSLVAVQCLLLCGGRFFRPLL